MGKSITEILEETKIDICDNYCKYTALIHEKYIGGEFETDRDADDYLIENYCNNCPLTSI